MKEPLFSDIPKITGQVGILFSKPFPKENINIIVSSSYFPYHVLG